MQKYLGKILFIVITATILYVVRVSFVERVADKQVKTVEQMQARHQATMEQRLEEQKEAQEQRRLDEPAQVLVRAKDVRACMADLGTDTLNNEVIECTKDHYITAKRRDVER
ncbi:hypothetical protein [Methylophilus sp. QUAN]|uniref:hypothetical protein n=1 Tax=Methylophilus sp. QUAN TaxID=2781020 RepID=UPI00188E18E0|nr:hypothetical protein [Methylophilus sp. QUAN]MBF4991882.1 hypothetical protein [Methylophilus sp. QUAN]